MAKHIKSIRFDDTALTAFEKYADWQYRVFGETISFSEFANYAFMKGLAETCMSLANIISNNSVVERMPCGTMKIRQFTPEQIEEITKLAAHCEAMFVDIETNE